MLAALILAIDNDISGLKIFLVMTFTLLTIPLAVISPRSLSIGTSRGGCANPHPGRKNPPKANARFRRIGKQPFKDR